MHHKTASCVCWWREQLTVTAYTLLQIPNLGDGRVLSTCAEEVAEAIELNTAIAALVEERKGLLVVGRSLGIVCVRTHVVLQVCDFECDDAEEKQPRANRRDVGGVGSISGDVR